jgi:hypothetical protein
MHDIRRAHIVIITRWRNRNMQALASPGQS